MRYPVYAYNAYIIVVAPSDDFLCKYDAIIFSQGGSLLDWLSGMTEEEALEKAVWFIDSGRLTHPNKPPNTGTPPRIRSIAPQHLALGRTAGFGLVKIGECDGTGRLL